MDSESAYRQRIRTRTILWTLALFTLFVLWDLTSLDLRLAHWFGTASGFPLRDHWLWSKVLHEGARRVAWALQLVLLLSVWWPFGVLRRPACARQRSQILGANALSSTAPRPSHGQR